MGDGLFGRHLRPGQKAGWCGAEPNGEGRRGDTGSKGARAALEALVESTRGARDSSWRKPWRRRKWRGQWAAPGRDSGRLWPTRVTTGMPCATGFRQGASGAASLVAGTPGRGLSRKPDLSGYQKYWYVREDLCLAGRVRHAGGGVGTERPAPPRLPTHRLHPPENYFLMTCEGP